jgi:mediator of RNA polymerase II transcription subunit 6
MEHLLNDFYKEAADMQYFTPATGYSYLPPVQKPTTTSGALDSARQSRAGTPLPESQSQSQARSSAKSAVSEQQQGTADLTSLEDDAMLMQSFQATIKYGDEFMDENPLIGEPGNFQFRSTQSQVQSQQAKAASQASAQASQQQSQDKAPPNSKAPSAVSTPQPPPLKTDPTTLAQRKGSKVMSPASASASASAAQSANPFKSQKAARKKSKAVTPGGTGAP